jgi:hypothetical protein
VKLQGGKSIMKAAKKPYAAPEMEVIYFGAADVLYNDGDWIEPGTEDGTIGG